MRPSLLAYSISVVVAALAVQQSGSAQQPAARPETAPQPSAAPSSNGLVPPVLKQDAEPQYPKEALEQKLTGEVLLALDIDAEGKVIRADVREPAGHGFDESASAAALQLLFEPARKEGKAVPSRILYRMRFTLKSAPEAVQPPAPSSGSLSGQVRLADGDVPLAGATVVLKLPDGRSVRANTDAEGRWTVSDIPPGQVTVHLEASGFEPWDGAESITAGEAIEVVHRMRVRRTDGALEVEVRGRRPDREITKRTLERKELTLIPGTSGDALKGVQAMPGIARPMGMSGMLVVRGSSPRGTAFFVDGMYVPQIYHFFGLSSVVPTEMIESIDFFPGNFSARYGRVTGGIIDVKLREPQYDGKYHGFAQIDLIDARMLARGPLPFAKNWYFTVAGRRSHIDAWLTPILEQSAGVRTAPVYYDWQAFAETRPTKRSSFRIGVMGFDDRMAVVLNDTSGMSAVGNSVSSSEGVFRVQAMYRNQVSDQVSINAMASAGFDREVFRVGSMYIDGHYRPITARGDVTWKVDPTLTLRAGPDLVVYPYSLDIRTPQPPDPGQPDPGMFNASQMIALNTSGSMTAPAGFVEAEITPVRPMKMVAGLRGDYFNKTGRFDLSPRINVRYDLHEGFPRTTVKAGAGLFYEHPEPVQVAPVYGASGLRSNRSTHYSVGFEQEFTKQVELSVEGFYKGLDDLVMQTPSNDGGLTYANIGDGRVVGAETLLRYKPDDRFFGWVAYTLSRSTRHNGPGEPERLFEYDQTHILTVLGSYSLGRGWQLGARFRLVSGNPYTPCLGGVLNAANGTYNCRSGPLLSQRVPAFNQLDVRVDKTWTFQAWKLTAYLDLQNAYNQKNKEHADYNYNYTKTQYDTGLPIIPSLGVRGEF